MPESSLLGLMQINRAFKSLLSSGFQLFLPAELAGLGTSGAPSLKIGPNDAGGHMSKPQHELSKIYARNVVARRKGFLRPLLHPLAGRNLPAGLSAQAVYSKAQRFSAGVRDPSCLQLIERIDQGPFHADSEIQPYFTGKQAFASMLAAVEEAEFEVMLEAYIISADETGGQFLEALRRAVARGVAVYVLADAFGSSRTRQDFWHLMRASGSQFRLFRRPRYAPRALLPILDHRKLLVVDRTLAFTGGMNIADEYHIGSGGQPAWRDTHVRVRGTLAWECALMFAESWESAGGDPLHFEGRELAGDQAAKALLLESRPGRGVQEIRSAYAAIMGAARHRLWISNAYFAPGRLILELLKATAQRGVDVRLLLPRQSDLPIIKAATRGYYSEMLNAGIKIHEFLPQVLHAKTLVADDFLCVIGSTNFDFRSFDFNYEANILALNDALGQQMSAQFERDLEQAEEVTLDSWKARPWWRRLINALARLLAPLL